MVTGYGLLIMTGVRGPREHSGYSDSLWAGKYDRIKRSEIAHWV
jgi:hypothetical protein